MPPAVRISRITSEVESVLRSWAIDTMEGFLRRMTNGRYMLITDDQHIEEAKTKRFADFGQRARREG